eukprot:1015587-Rhodomonas_salina.1
MASPPVGSTTIASDAARPHSILCAPRQSSPMSARTSLASQRRHPRTLSQVRRQRCTPSGPAAPRAQPLLTALVLAAPPPQPAASLERSKG